MPLILRKALPLFCALILCASSAAVCADSPARIDWPSSVALPISANDTLEFTLALPKSLTENAPESSTPEVGVWFLENNAKEPAPDSPSAGKVLILRSARPSEWIIQVRGLRPPRDAASSLLVRWKFARPDGTSSSGDIAYPGRILSGSKPLDVVLLMDGSWSMNESDPKRMRIAAVREFIQTARLSNVIGRVAIVQFDNRSVTLIGFTPISENFNPTIDRISAVGLTDINGGIRHSMQVIEDARLTDAAIVLFTDGNQEPGPYKDSHLLARKAGVAIHTMTLGRDADRTLLRRIAEDTGGSYADAQKDNDISAAYGAIVSKLTRLRTISAGPLNADSQFPVDPTCSALLVAATSTAFGALKLDLPGARNWSSGDATNPQYFAESPIVGTVNARWESRQQDVPATFAASARTALYPLFFKASPLPAAAVELDANDPNLAVSLFNENAPVLNAKVEAHFEYIVWIGERKEKLGATVPLFDNGTSGDGAANDGVYASGDEALSFISLSADKVTGAVKVVVSGTEQNQPFRRELNAAFESARTAPPALLVNGSFDFGTIYAGDAASSSVNLRVRGPGGAFSVGLQNTPPLLADALKSFEPPASLKSKERRALRLDIATPELLAPGDYSGIARLSLSNVDSVDLPWRVKVLSVQPNVDPLNLGAVFPGAKIAMKLKIGTSGGSLQLATISHPWLASKAFEPVTINKESREIELLFAVPETATTIPPENELILTDSQKRIRARLPVSLSVSKIAFKKIPPIDFGSIESGDKIEREFLIEWENGDAPPLQPKLAVAPGNNLPVDLIVAPPTPSGNSWRSKISTQIPPKFDSAKLSGSMNIEAGPAKQTVDWSVNVINPSLNIDAKSIDFGRVYPGKKSERKITLRADSARPVDVEISALPFNKPKVAGVEMPASALVFTAKITVPPGAKFELPLTFSLPDGAQDGQYQSMLTLRSRLGNFEIPLTVKAVDFVDAAAFHVSPVSITFRITEGDVLPRSKFTITSHDDEPLQLALKVPLPLNVPAPLAYLFADENKVGTSSDSDLSAALAVTLPPRGSVTVFTRPRADARNDETGAIHIDAETEHQEIELRAERFVAPVISIVTPEPPRLLNYILSFFVLLLIVAAVLVRLLVKQNGIRYVCYAIFIHLGVFSMGIPRQVIMDALPESIEVSLLDAQESLGMSLSNTQSRRLEALHSGGGGTDDNRGPVAPTLAQSSLANSAAPSGPVELAAPAAGPASPKPGPMNLDAARGVEAPVRPAAIPEQARGAATAPITDDAPLAIDAKNVVQEKPAPAEKISTEAPRQAASTALQSAPVSNVAAISSVSNFTVAEVAPNATAPREVTANAFRSPRPNIAAEPEQPLNFNNVVVENASARRVSATTDDAPARIGDEAPLAFDSQPFSAPQVKPNPNVTPADTPRSTPVSASETGNGASGLALLGAPLTALNLSAPGAPGAPGNAPGESYVAMARTSTLPALGSSAGYGGDGLPGGGTGTAFSVTDTGAGTGVGRVGGGLLAGGDEPLAIGTDGGDGPGGKSGGPGSGSGRSGGSGSGNGNSLIGGLQTGNGQIGNGGSGGNNGSGGSGRSTAAGGGGMGGTGSGFATGGGGNGNADFGMLAGSGNEWHGRPGGGGKGVSLAAGPGSAQLEKLGGGPNNGGAGGLGNGGNSGGNGGASKIGDGGAPGGKGMGPGGRVPGFGMNDDGPGGLGDKPFAAGPLGGGGSKESGKGIASGGGLPQGKGGGGGDGVGRIGAAGGSGLGGSGGGGGTGFGGLGGDNVGGSGGGRRPGQGGVSLARGPGSQQLEESGGGFKSNALGVIPGPPNRGISTPYTGGLIRVSIGLTKHSGDWNSSPTALQFLRSAFIERSGLPELEVNIPTIELSDLAGLLKCRMIMITSNAPIAYKPAEIDAVREYIKRGGTVWINDSSANDYEKFDEGFRPLVSAFMPGGKLEKLELDHDFFAACYDLSKGYKGFRIPPGDKYRQDYMEAVFVPDETSQAKNAEAEVADLEALKHRRAGIIYTRNDYADGMEIDPRMNAGMKSLTDLTNAEMLESSLRFGMNLIAYSMGPKGLKLPPPPETIAEFEKLYRYNGGALPVLDDYSVMQDQWNKSIWVAEKDWCNETMLDFQRGADGKATVLRVSCVAGPKFKSVVSRFLATDLSKTRALVFDLDSQMTQGLNVALMFHTKDGKAFESRAVFVRPGANKGLRFPLEMGDMKSSVSKVPWQAYDTAFEPRTTVERISILLYNLNETGTVKIGKIYQQK